MPPPGNLVLRLQCEYSDGFTSVLEHLFIIVFSIQKVKKIHGELSQDSELEIL